MSVPTIAYIRNKANQLLHKTGVDNKVPVTNGDLHELVQLIVDLAGFIDLDCQNSHVRVNASRP